MITAPTHELLLPASIVFIIVYVSGGPGTRAPLNATTEEKDAISRRVPQFKTVTL